MDELKIAYQVFCEVWLLARKYGSRKLTDDEWKVFVDTGFELQDKYRKQGKSIELLFHDLFGAVQGYYERFKK